MSSILSSKRATATMKTISFRDPRQLMISSCSLFISFCPFWRSSSILGWLSGFRNWPKQNFKPKNLINFKFKRQSQVTEMSDETAEVNFCPIFLRSNAHLTKVKYWMPIMELGRWWNEKIHTFGMTFHENKPFSMSIKLRAIVKILVNRFWSNLSRCSKLASNQN